MTIAVYGSIRNRHLVIANFRPFGRGNIRYHELLMANPEHLAILRQGVEAWNEWRSAKPDVRPDLYEADLRQADLSKADLHETLLGRANLEEVNLTTANLRGAYLGEASLPYADFSGADLSSAYLQEAYLGAADLSQANLSATNLRVVNLVRANLDHANLSYAKIANTLFADVDLSSVSGLASVSHEGPSTIGIDTIVRSKGKIPDAFLRGVGISEPFITNMKALIGAMDPIQFYSCFISYSTKDQEFADRLYADLQAKGVRSWFAPHDLQGGRKLHEQIDEAIRLHDKLLLTLSPSSMGSEWVMTEISMARRREMRDKARVLFPISLAPFDAIRDWECFDADIGKDSAREIREYFIPDFSNWKDHDSYQNAFERLLKDLRAASKE
jgi:TIR domain/Pentapeptide repeats (8 copies)